MSSPGPLIAAGRAAEIFDIGGGRVLRRFRDPGRSHDAEAAIMVHARTHGVPVPEVIDVDATGMVLERLDGPTMLADCLRRPSRIPRHARTMADLMRRLHRVPALSGLRDRYGGGHLIHLDLHPGNIILTADRPVLIDWETAANGPADADLARSWMLLRLADIEGPLALRLIAHVGRAQFTRRFMRGFDAAAMRAMLPAIAADRIAEPYVTPGEVRRLSPIAARAGRPAAAG